MYLSLTCKLNLDHLCIIKKRRKSRVVDKIHCSIIEWQWPLLLFLILTSHFHCTEISSTTFLLSYSSHSFFLFIRVLFSAFAWQLACHLFQFQTFIYFSCVCVCAPLSHLLFPYCLSPFQCLLFLPSLPLLPWSRLSSVFLLFFYLSSTTFFSLLILFFNLFENFHLVCCLFPIPVHGLFQSCYTPLSSSLPSSPSLLSSVLLNFLLTTALAFVLQFLFYYLFSTQYFPSCHVFWPLSCLLFSSPLCCISFRVYYFLLNPVFFVDSWFQYLDTSLIFQFLHWFLLLLTLVS